MTVGLGLRSSFVFSTMVSGTTCSDRQVVEGMRQGIEEESEVASGHAVVLTCFESISDCDAYGAQPR